ncbi:hypothetical protein CRENBAI_006579 [Crenichthys baileyi]|uniref:NADPH:adrenodoxin oxidoreductase, mitochondrial n=1 Tax=Crenichthys baileyi TaxID=28760 RepID=A0AAV9QYM7_9TELE
MEVPGDKELERRKNATKIWGFRFYRSPTEIFADPNVSCGLVISSIGYKSLSIDPTVPFDSRRAIVPNSVGRVHQAAGLYCSGWLKTGPTGVIATTMNNSFDTARSLLEDVDSGTLDISTGKPGSQIVNMLLEERGVKPVTFSDWEKIDSLEMRKGEACGKPREKLLTVEEMLKVART